MNLGELSADASLCEASAQEITVPGGGANESARV
jgi:hypothetical protein